MNDESKDVIPFIPEIIGTVLECKQAEIEKTFLNMNLYLTEILNIGKIGEGDYINLKNNLKSVKDFYMKYKKGSMNG